MWIKTYLWCDTNGSGSQIGSVRLVIATERCNVFQEFTILLQQLLSSRLE